MNRKFWIIYCIELIIFGLLLFGAAGKILWPAGWAFMILIFGAGLIFGYLASRHDPVLLQERMKSPFQQGQPLWDKIFIIILIILWPCWLVLMALDAGRFHWSSLPYWLQFLGAMGILVSYFMIYRIFLENTFLIAVVKIQTDRTHKVISTGPYAIVRHPMYATTLILFPSIALLLGSKYGLISSIILIAAIIFRTVMEDRELIHGLEGYKEYTARVKFRLIPYIW